MAEDPHMERIEAAATNPAAFVRPRLSELKGIGCSGTVKPGVNQAVPPVFYLPGQLLTNSPDAVVEALRRLDDGPEWGDPEYLNRSVAVVPISSSADPVELAGRISPDLPDEVIVGPHHVFTLGPVIKTGPGSDPLPTEDQPKQGTKVTTPFRVAIVDTGMFQPPPTHLERGRASSVVDYDDPDKEDVDLDTNGVIDLRMSAHGGFIAGIVNSMAPGTHMVVESAVVTQNGARILTEQSVVDAVDQALAKGDIGVINLSLGSYRGPGTELVLLHNAVRRWKRRGVLIVAAAGNDATDDKWYPAAYADVGEFKDCVVSVGALEDYDDPVSGPTYRAASFSNYGPWVTSWAPGVDLVSDYPDGDDFPNGLVFEYFDDGGGTQPFATLPFTTGLAKWSGTSFAAPYVAAEICRFAAAYGMDAKKAWIEMRQSRAMVMFTPRAEAYAKEATGRKGAGKKGAGKKGSGKKPAAKRKSTRKSPQRRGRSRAKKV